ncbi:energy-converting hydrogenase B subunit J [uncultured Methanobrevibacter sp.]|uniref:energy-converting hydrogenase B subunit J n=1 Tax=uncultured Methanobrevibacter sp. TaxID=253161 RepID=UPI0025D2EE46|nr:energy-converting hydrogenase B subunit J [uncultured Methanobrevibacter sp.]
MISWGPIIVGLIFGLVVGFSFRKNEYFNYSSLLFMFIFLLIISCLEGEFPFYENLPISLGFFSASLGLVIGKLLFGRKENSNKNS